MYQQINLYQPVFRHEKKIFSALALLELLGLILLLLVGVYGLLRWQLSQLDDDLAALQQHHTTLSSQIERMEQAQAGKDLEALDQQIQSLEQRSELLAQLLDRMDTFAAPGSRFSTLLTDLAKVQIPGLWLTRIHLQAGGTTTLEGTAMAPETVPRYLRQLADQPQLGRKHLDQVEIARNPDQPRRLHFTLSDQPLEGREAPSRRARTDRSSGPRYSRSNNSGEPAS